MKKLLFFCFIFSSCSTGATKKTAEVECFPDSFFKLFNVSDAPLLSDFEYGEGSDIFLGRSFLKELDSAEKQNLLFGILKNGFPPYTHRVHFVAKQEKIGRFQQIIIQVGGTDYLTSMILLLDENCRPVSHYILEGKDCEGVFETDSTIMACPIKRNHFDGNVVQSTEIRRNEYLHSDKILIDSLSYETEFDTSGQFNTRLIDSVRYITTKRKKQTSIK
ncbi:MAG: hypothetical protein ACKOE6_15740 [Flammeovirgaceae bacterium]